MNACLLIKEWGIVKSSVSLIPGLLKGLKLLSFSFIVLIVQSVLRICPSSFGLMLVRERGFAYLENGWVDFELLI